MTWGHINVDIDNYTKVNCGNKQIHIYVTCENRLGKLQRGWCEPWHMDTSNVQFCGAIVFSLLAPIKSLYIRKILMISQDLRWLLIFSSSLPSSSTHLFFINHHLLIISLLSPFHNLLTFSSAPPHILIIFYSPPYLSTIISSSNPPNLSFIYSLCPPHPSSSPHNIHLMFYFSPPHLILVFSLLSFSYPPYLRLISS